MELEWKYHDDYDDHDDHHCDDDDDDDDAVVPVARLFRVLER